MFTRDARHKYSESALKRWSSWLSRDWEHYFQPHILELGRKYYRRNSIIEVELTPQDLTVSVETDDGEAYSIVEWSRIGPMVRDSRNDHDLGQAIAVAGLYEIEELLADRLTPLPFEKTAPTPKAVAEKPENSDSSPSGNPEERPVLLFFIEGEKLCFRALPNGSHEESDSNQRRERLIQLSHMARRSGFKFNNRSAVFEMAESEKFLSFLRNGVPGWRSSFDIHQTSEVELLNLGQREVRLQASVHRSSDSGGLRLEWSSHLGEDTLSDEEIARLLRRKESPLFLPGRGLVRLDPEGIEISRQLENLPGGRKRDLPPYLFLSLFQTHSVTFRLSPEVQEWIEALKSPDPEPPAGTPDFLRPYQRRGVAHLFHLCNNDCHPLLADEMGLGKTIQILALLHCDGFEIPSLVVCPASVVSVWTREAQRFFPDMPFRVLRSGDSWREHPGGCLWVASYTQLRRHRSYLEDAQFRYAVLDEAQQIKNPDAKVSRACFAIKANHRIALTGTPVENSHMDLWSIFRFLMPDLLGSRREFFDEMNRDRKALVERVRIQAAPFLIRRTKKEVVQELPDKVETELLCSMGDQQRKVYNRIAETVFQEFKSGFRQLSGQRSLHFLTAITRLRQACCDLRLLPEDFREEAGITDDLPLAGMSGKLETLSENLQEILVGPRKVVIFSQFVSLLDRTEELLAQQFPQIRQFRLTGSTRDRESPVAEFQKHRKAAVMLVSLKAGGTGITLHAADYVFLLDPWWNPAAEQQAIDRVHRIGQQKTVFVYRLVAQGTIEENIQKLKAEKTGLFKEIVESSRPLEAIRSHFDTIEGFLKPSE
ncbi:DEAD/DEAH box helicase [Puniceicoccus vermicola]|nr:DEAD/DEAH box helicase [Puniceicoccus vermicola]